MSIRKNSIVFFILFMCFVANPLAALSCATCGCSELCPLVMMREGENFPKHGILTESIWGSIILKMAFQRDPQLQKLRKHTRTLAAITGTSISGAVGGTFAQNIVSLGTLNPPDGQSDSYLPGSIGLGMSGLVNVAFDGSLLLNWRLRHKMVARQEVIQARVETILKHLEFSEANCPEAKHDLTELIGERAAQDCMKLWHSSHNSVASKVDQKQVSDAGNLSPKFENVLSLADASNSGSYASFVP
jgi:hypothetical protein